MILIRVPILLNDSGIESNSPSGSSSSSLSNSVSSSPSSSPSSSASASPSSSVSSSPSSSASSSRSASPSSSASASPSASPSASLSNSPSSSPSPSSSLSNSPSASVSSSLSQSPSSSLSNSPSSSLSNSPSASTSSSLSNSPSASLSSSPSQSPSASLSNSPSASASGSASASPSGEDSSFEPHTATSILEALQLTFETIFNIGSPVPSNNNSMSTESLSVVSSGIYQSTVSRVYTVTITQGGQIGVTRCSITDSLNSDSVLSNVLIQNGAEINVGSRGAKITFTLNTTDEFVTGDNWTIQCNHLYYTNVKNVVQAQVTPTTLDELPSIAFAFTNIPYDDNGSSNNFRCDMEVNAELWIAQNDSQNIQSQLLYGLKDIERALKSNPLLDGYAKDTKIINCQPFLPVPGRPFAAISVDIGIWFDNYIQ